VLQSPCPSDLTTDNRTFTETTRPTLISSVYVERVLKRKATEFHPNAGQQKGKKKKLDTPETYWLPQNSLCLGVERDRLGESWPWESARGAGLVENGF